MIYNIEEELEKYELAKTNFSNVPADKWESTEVVTDENGRTYTAGVKDGMLFELQPNEEETTNTETQEAAVIPNAVEDIAKGSVRGMSEAGKNTTSFVSNVVGAPGDVANWIGQNITSNENFDMFLGGEDINNKIQQGLTWVGDNIMGNNAVDQWAAEDFNNETLGQVSELIAQFATPAIPAAKVTKAADLLITGMQSLNPFKRSLIWGAIADAAAFPENQETLTGVLAKYVAGQTPEERTAFGNAIVDVFEKNPEHAGLVNQLKGSLEGLVLGSGIEAFMRVAVMGSKLINWKELFDRFEFDPNTVSMGGFGGINIAARPDRVKTTGQYIGYPEGIDTPNKLYNLRNKLLNLAKEGESGKFWYERSGQAILDAVGGDKVEAEKIIQAIAITSTGSTPVQANMGFALQAYSQWKAGKDILTGKFPTAMSQRLKDLFEGKNWEGRKSNSFYNNLMRVVDPTKEQNVTADIWMSRILGLKNTDGTPFTGAPSLQQYNAIEREVNRIAQKLGWEPQQVQAAMWVAAKAKAAGKSADEMKFDYSDALQNNLGQISWESIPGRTSGHFKEMFDAPYEQQVEYHQAISKAFLDENGADIVAKELGIVSPRDFEAPGYFEGKVSPGTQTEVAAPKMYKGPAYGKVEPAVEELITAYATARGVLLKQDGVGWHRPFYNPLKKDANGIELRIGRDWSEEEVDQFAKILKELAGHGEYNPIASPEGIRILNFDYLEFDNLEFAKLIKNAISKLNIETKTADIKYFNSQNGYVGNDWSVNKNGEDYFRELGGERRSNVYGKVRTIIEKIQTRIDDIDTDFSDKYGWTKNEAINTEFKPGTIEEIVP